jgi:hypothetical protein
VPARKSTPGFDWFIHGVSKKFPVRLIFDKVKKLAGCLSLQASDSEAAGAEPPSERGDGRTADD